MFKEIKELGVGGIELNFNLSRTMAKDFSILVKKGEAKIISIHNYCPIPDGVNPKKASPDNPSLSSTDEAERKLAVKCTKDTIDFANEVMAKAVVLHIGKVEIEDKTIELSRISKVGPLHAKVMDEMKEERDTHAKLYFEKAVKSLEELEPYARGKDICLGVENRYYFKEIPSIEEISYILGHFGDASIYYWHDVGHAQAQENIGFDKQENYLKRFWRKLLGIHLHDIIGVEDHKVPGEGNFDFSRLKPYIKEGVFKVIEAHQPATTDEMVRGIKFLENVLKDH